MLQKFLVLISGIIFGLGLTISNMTNPDKVLSFLDIFGSWDPSLMFVLYVTGRCNHFPKLKGRIISGLSG